MKQIIAVAIAIATLASCASAPQQPVAERHPASGDAWLNFAAHMMQPPAPRPTTNCTMMPFGPGYTMRCQ